MVRQQGYCSSIGYGNYWDALNKHVDDAAKGGAKCDALGGKQGVATMNETGFYRLIFRNNRSIAKRSGRWSANKILPSISKTGGYMAGRDNMSDVKLLSRAILVAQRQIERLNSHIRVFLPQRVR